VTVVVESLINWLEGKDDKDENFDTNISSNGVNTDKINNKIEKIHLEIHEKINNEIHVKINGQNSIKIKKYEKKKNSTNGEIEEEENFEIKNVNIVMNGNGSNANGGEQKGNVRVTRSKTTHCYKE